NENTAFQAYAYACSPPPPPLYPPSAPRGGHRRPYAAPTRVSSRMAWRCTLPRRPFSSPPTPSAASSPTPAGCSTKARAGTSTSTRRSSPPSPTPTLLTSSSRSYVACSLLTPSSPTTSSSPPSLAPPPGCEASVLVFDSLSAKNSVVWTALVSGYASNGYTDEALELFRSMPGRGLFAWTALVSGYVRAGESVSAVELFVEMRRDAVTIDDAFVLSAVTGGAADLAALVLGRQLHGLSMRLGFLSSMMVGNALVDMYSKCSDIHSAREVFEEITVRDIISWTTMIVGEAQHGRAGEAFALYDRMILAGVKPNEVTFVGLIYACSHAGLVQKGRQLFDSVKREYDINPGLQLYTCYLDLLSRSGHLSEAEELITTMPYEPDEAAWGALLSACKKHNDAEMCVRVADNLLELGPKYPSTCVLLSNVYAVNGKWGSVSTVRKLMANMKINKEPGYSWVEVGRESRLFHAGEVPVDMREEILVFLEELVSEMRRRGYVPDTSSVMHDLEEHEKEHHLFLHSERLAVAFGILKSLPGSVIRVVKNLRVCGDCHTVMKLISEIFQRKIIVRDATRFHHFEGGKCSCGEFW
uniref:DYW domain-containing protein n=1 Tax=Aegilops tauschii subsp. strangulata TaxID=200361 RepID=A0A452Z4X7_AEGTS